MGLGQLYVPKGKALEHTKFVLNLHTGGVRDAYAVNVALGCPCCPTVCYGPIHARKTREEWVKVRVPKVEPVDLVRKQLEKGLHVEGVFLSFLTDPFLPINRESSERLINYLMNQQEEIDVDIVTATSSKLGISTYSWNRNGISLMSPYKGFSEVYEPGALSPDDRIKLVEQTYEDGEICWISQEPFPVQDIYPYEMKDIIKLWERLHELEVDAIIFGKWNYDPRASTPKAREEYAMLVDAFTDFCKDHDITHKIKADTLKFIGRG